MLDKIPIYKHNRLNTYKIFRAAKGPQLFDKKYGMVERAVTYDGEEFQIITNDSPQVNNQDLNCRSKRNKVNKDKNIKSKPISNNPLLNRALELCKNPENKTPLINRPNQGMKKISPKEIIEQLIPKNMIQKDNCIKKPQIKKYI